MTVMQLQLGNYEGHMLERGMPIDRKWLVIVRLRIFKW